MRTLVFSDRKNGNNIKVFIPEELDPEYGMYTWPCAPVLAQFVWYNRHWIAEKTILELGAGTALPGIVAAKCGAIVHLSDSARLPKCRETCLKSCRANGLQGIPVHGITWGRFGKQIFRLPKLDIILASDCFYDTKDFEDIIATVSFMLERNKGAQFIFTYQERSSARTIEHLLERWNLSARQIPLSDFGAGVTCLAGSDLPGNHTIHLFRLTSNEKYE